MSEDSAFDRALDQALLDLADGKTPDWTALEAAADTPKRKAIVAEVRLLDQEFATSHPASDEAETQPPQEEVPPPARTSTGDPTRWGRYQLVGRLGKGSYGVVFRGIDPKLKRDVAIKLFDHADPDRVDREGTLLASIDHHNVVKVYDVADHDGRYGLCMEFIDGRTYDAILRADGPMHPKQVAVDGQAVCRALAALHNKDVLHRDVSARNVMRARGGRVVLMDLGAGLILLPGQSGSLRNVGTPLFMAPELFGSGATSASPRTDVYSLGVLLYYMASGRYPVEGKSTEEIEANHRNGTRVAFDVRLPESEPAFAQLIERATARDPAARYQSAPELLRDLNRIVAPPPAPIPVPVPKPDHWYWVGATAASLAAAITLAGISGFLTTFAFNYVVDLPPEFDGDSAFDKVLMGGRSLVQPGFVMGVLLGLGAIANLVLRIAGWPVRLWRRAWTAVLLRDLKPEEHATAIAQVAVLIGFVALIVVYLTFEDVRWSLTRSVTDKDLASYWVFGSEPRSSVERVAYRGTLAALLLLVVVSWRRVRTVRLTRGGSVPVWIKGAGVALGSVLFVLCQAPYKLMNYNEKPVSIYAGARCYVLGERGEDARIYCPSSDVPRVRTIRVSGTPFERCGVEESVFQQTELTTCSAAAGK